MPDPPPEDTDQILATLANSLQQLTTNQVALNAAVAKLGQAQTKVASSQIVSPQAQNTGLNCNFFDQFDESKEKFSTYKCRLENYFDLRGIKEDQSTCAKMLLHCIGPVHFETLAAYTAPESPTTFTYTELIKLLEGHVMPAPNIIVEQHRFLNRLQKPDENITSYVAELRKFIPTCNFNCHKCKESVADIFLRAQFVRGLKDTVIREKLLQDNDPKFADVIQKASNLEASQLDSTEMSKSAPSPANNVNQISGNRSKNKNFSNNRDRGRNRSRGRPQFNQNRSFSQNCSFPPNRRAPSRGRPNFQELGVADLCLRCARNNHKTKDCRLDRNKVKCELCGNIGHVAKVCIISLSKQRPRRNVNNLNSFNNAESSNKNFSTPVNSVTSSYYPSSINTVNVVSNIKSPIGSSESDKIYATILVEGKPQRFEVDSGSKYTLISNRSFNKLNLDVKLEPADIIFSCYLGNSFKAHGKVTVSVRIGDRGAENAVMYVVDGERDCVLGREWIRLLQLDLLKLDQVRSPVDSSVFSILQVSKDVVEIQEMFAETYKQVVGCIPEEEVKGILRLREKARPVFMKARPVPFALCDKVDEELDTLVEQGVLTPTPYSDWGSPLVVVPKPNGTVRLCVDHKVGVNPQIEDTHYPIPKIDEILNELRDAKFFCTLDLFKAYHHIPVDEDTAKIQTLSTHKGTYRVNRLSQGIKTAPSEFHRIFQQILSGLDGTIAYFDDIIIFADTYAECKKRLIACLQRLKKFNLHVNNQKCRYFEEQIEYLGHVISHNKIAKSPKKVEALLECPRPQSPTDVKCFLGLITYYSRFIPKASEKTYPLRMLLQKNRRFHWSAQCEAAFQQLKAEIASDQVIVPYNPELPVSLACDASPRGIAAVLSHRVKGEERPIAFASRSLTAAEQNYSQLDKEALAIYWGIHKFFEYLFGRKFTLITDNRPLYHIFHQNSKIPPITATRLLRYAAFLTAFDYTIFHRKSQYHANADFLSRAPLNCPDMETDSAETDELHHQVVNQISSLEINCESLAKATQEDEELRKLKEELLAGTNAEPEYSLQDGIIFRGSRILVPKKLRPEILKELHHTHLGISKMKSLARRYCYWPGIDKEIESLVKSCNDCASVKGDPPKAELHHWETPQQNFQRVHIDYAGPLDGHNILILVDAKSKWPEIRSLKSAPTSTSTIRLLYEIFTTHGFPEVLVSDNATIFTSEEFTSFCTRNGIKQKFIAPGHPATNGLAERYVQILKNKLKSMGSVRASMEEKIQEIVFRFRATPLAEGKSPAELYLNRQIRISLDALKPQKEQPRQTSSPPGSRQLNVGDRVQSKNHPGPPKWKLGVVVKKFGRLHYSVKLDDGRVLKRHINQLRKTEIPEQQRRVTFGPMPTVSQKRHYRAPILANREPAQQVGAPAPMPHSQPLPQSQPLAQQASPQLVRMSGRARKAPGKFSDFIRY